MRKLINGAAKLGLQLNAGQLEQFDIYYRELTEWNQRMNLTAITDYEEVQIKHFLDSLTVTLAWQQPIADAQIRLIDIGTGAGIPGIPLKLMFPDIKLTLLEVTVKKAGFLNHIIRKLGLDSVEVVSGRAEGIAHQTQYREKFDAVLSRAVASLPTLVELTLPFCAVGGSLIAQKKGDIVSEVNEAARAIFLLGGSLREMKRVELEELADDRWLVIIDKVSATPEQYPRRAGVPAKRPIAQK